MTSPSISLVPTLSDVVGLASRELERLGLKATHYLARVHCAPDSTTCGAEYAVTLMPRKAKTYREALAQRLLVLIQQDGSISVTAPPRRWRKRG